MKARKVKGLDCDAPLADNAQRMVLARLDELFSFAPQALDREEVQALHDMRIAAKRLRYVLEVTAPVLGPYAATAAKRARDVQDLLGEIHDCDVTLPRLEALVAELGDADAAAVRARAGDAPDLDPALVAGAPHAAEYRGLISMANYVRARRVLLFERFCALWTELNREGLRARLEFAAAERVAA